MIRLVADTNAIFASLISNSSSRKILMNPNFEFSVPDFSRIEISKYKQMICDKAEITQEDFDILLSFLFEKIIVIPYEEYSYKMNEAKRIIEETDIKDAPFIACALAIKSEGIWTEDKGFLKQSIIKIFKTKDFLVML